MELSLPQTSVGKVSKGNLGALVGQASGYRTAPSLPGIQQKRYLSLTRPVAIGGIL